ncbi:hypothetical protein [Aestuariivirga sp.]|uniref:hypothetical protein n=1 Tax=Aestuariivirga sp. TaxID=2650926 RepID=UPI003919790E
MMMKSLIAATAVAGAMTLALPASEAKADVDVNIGIGLGGYYPGHYYGGYPVRHRYKVSCQTGRNIVDRSGFNRVRAIDCTLPSYKYSAWKRGHKFVVSVNRTGDITRVRKVF